MSAFPIGAIIAMQSHQRRMQDAARTTNAITDRINRAIKAALGSCKTPGSGQDR